MIFHLEGEHVLDEVYIGLGRDPVVSEGVRLLVEGLAVLESTFWGGDLVVGERVGCVNGKLVLDEKVRILKESFPLFCFAILCFVLTCSVCFCFALLCHVLLHFGWWVRG